MYERRAAAFVLRLAGDADAQVAQMGDEPVVLVRLEDHQVGSLAAPLKEAGAGRGFVRGREELNEGAVAGRQHGVVQAELRQGAGAARLHAQDAAVQVDTLGQVVDHHGDLAKLGEHGVGYPSAEGTAAVTASAAARCGCLLQLALQGFQTGLGDGGAQLGFVSFPPGVMQFTLGLLRLAGEEVGGQHGYRSRRDGPLRSRRRWCGAVARSN